MQIYTILKAGRSRVPFLVGSRGFFIDVILPAALEPWGTQPLTEVPGMCPGSNGGRCIQLTTLPLPRADFLEILEVSNFWNPKEFSRPL